MFKLIPILVLFNLILGYEFSAEDTNSIINFNKLNYKQKIDTLLFLQNQSNKIIINFSSYRQNVEMIIAIINDSLKIELLNAKFSSLNNQQSISKNNRTNLYEKNTSNSKMISINDIQTINIINNPPWYISLLPIFLTIAILQMFGM